MIMPLRIMDKSELFNPDLVMYIQVYSRLIMHTEQM